MGHGTWEPDEDAVHAGVVTLQRMRHEELARRRSLFGTDRTIALALTGIALGAAGILIVLLRL